MQIANCEIQHETVINWHFAIINFAILQGHLTCMYPVSVTPKLLVNS